MMSSEANCLIFSYMKSIFEFIDYRKFLGYYYEEQKKKTRFFSYRYFARKAGINSPSFLKHVIDGKRRLTRPVIDKFCSALSLNAKESLYFRNLVFFNQAKTSEEKREHYAVLRSMAGGVKESVLNADQYDYFANWYTSVIRELVCLHDFKDDYTEIAAALRPQILPSEAKKALGLLLRLGLVKRKPDGSYNQTDPALLADSSITSLAVRSFTQSMVDHTKNALYAFNKNERHISGMTIGISPETYAVLAAEIEAFKDRVKIIVTQDREGSRIYQLNCSLFPLSTDLRTQENGNDGKGKSS
jgi:uncharacterized protein (TIGR02147 family)